MGLSLAGDEVTVEPLPGNPSYLGSIDIEVDFMKRGHEIAEVFSADEMVGNFLRAFSGMIFAAGETLIFEFHGQNLKASIKGVSIVELAAEQRRGASPGATNMGIVFEKTDINFVKGGNSGIKIKSSAKKWVPFGGFSSC
jgi:vesicle-fusing ATPase